MSNFLIVQVTYLPVLTTGLIDLELLGKSELARGNYENLTATAY